MKTKVIAPIQVFVRHCHYSNISAHKDRFSHFSRELCYENFMKTLPKQGVDVTFLLDTFHPLQELHFVKKQKKFPVIEIKEGTETGSFLCLLDHVIKLSLPPETIIYFLEDDYLHREGWVDILLEGFSLPCADYVTLYDHRDKYFHPNYLKNLKSKIYCTTSCHWRTTPSTTNTYAMRHKTLLAHLDIHRAFSSKGTISQDHEKFVKLHKIGATLISSIPGWSTHAEPKFASPCYDWGRFFDENF